MVWRPKIGLPLILAIHTVWENSVLAEYACFASHLPPVFHSSLRSQQGYRPSSVRQQSEERETGDSHLFLRFSPLIGGPAFLPLHVEVIIAVEEANRGSSTKQKQNMDTIYIRKANNLSVFKEPSQLHRFDFLPEKPTDPSTLTRLLTLKAVPGRLRYRTHASHERHSEVSQNMSTQFNDNMGTLNQDEKGVTILIPVGSLMSIEGGDEVAANTILTTATEFNDKYGDTLFKELRILGGKNCLSFALDLLSHVELTTGLQRIPRFTKFDIE